MVKKLFKHEYLAWLRVLPLIYGIALVIAAMLRLLIAFETDSIYYNIVLFFAVLMFGASLLVTMAAPTVFGILRFYKNLFTGEGYLTHTLPVTPAAQMWVKLLAAVSFDLASLLIVLLAGIIAASGELFTEICNAIAYLFEMIPEDMAGHLAGWGAEFALLTLALLLTNYLMFYLCICIGQLVRKNRVLAAVGVYFGLYVISQIISTIMTVVFAILGESGALDNLLLQIGEHPIASSHIFLCCTTGLTMLLGIAYYLICHRIIRKKLNLE